MARRLAARAVRLTEALEASGVVTTTVDRASGRMRAVPASVATAPVPAHVRRAARDALARGETHYTSRPGIPELRGAIARRLTAEGFPTDPGGVVVTNGGAEGLYIVLQALVSAGTRVVMPEPVLPNVAAMVDFIGGDLVRVPTTAASRFVPAADDLLAAGGDVILLASPSPVTGVALSPDETRALAAGAASRGAVLVLDRSLVPAATDPATVAFGAPELGAEVVVVGSFSSGYGLTGWRVGYFVSPARLIKTMQGLKQAMSICTTAVSQFAALAALDDVDGWQGERRAASAQLVADATAALAAVGLPVVTPDAGNSLLVDTRTIDADDRAVVARLGAGSAGQPGSVYGPATVGFTRVTLGAPASGDTTGRLASLAGEGTQA